MTFEEYVQMDPRIGELLRDARRADPGDKQFCGLVAWHGEPGDPGSGLKTRLVKLVGFECEHAQPAALHTSVAYDVVYPRIFDAIPPCRKCSCVEEDLEDCDEEEFEDED